MLMSILHVQVNAAYPCPRCMSCLMSMNMLHFHVYVLVNATWHVHVACYVMLHVYAHYECPFHATCKFPRCMSTSVQHVYARSACQYSCRMWYIRAACPMSLLPVSAASPCSMTVQHLRAACPCCFFMLQVHDGHDASPC